MNDILTAIAPYVPLKYLWVLGAIPLIGRGIEALRNGGGLKGLWGSVMYGRSVPKPDAKPTDPNAKP